MGFPGARAVVTLVLIAVSSTTSPAQTELPAPMHPSAFELLLPRAVQAGYLTREWIRDAAVSDTATDQTALVDSIYLHALTETEGNVDAAIFAALIAVFEHRTIPFSFGLTLPLAAEPDSLFRRRVANLPSRLFADRPHGDDRDKLQHFFASALLARALDEPELADAIGTFVEWGEAAFVRGGADDPRDIRANRLGQLFSELLRDDPTLLPGAVFRAWNRRFHER